MRLTGKGRKTRIVPLLPETVTLLRGYMEAHGLLSPEAAERPVFGGRYGKPMSRSGVRYLLAEARALGER